MIKDLIGGLNMRVAWSGLNMRGSVLYMWRVYEYHLGGVYEYHLGGL